jgi:hypothetical protein
MNKWDFLALGAVIWIGYRYQRSHRSTSVVEQIYANEAQNFVGLAGSNFTQSVWDAQSGQPSYMWGTVPAQGGLSVQGGASGSIFGHIA